VPLSAIAGHSSLVRLLTRAVASGRVPQSLLFAGPDGVGKRTTALALAQALNCRTPVDGDGCGVCNICRRIAAGTFSDVTVIDRGDVASIGIDVLRERLLTPVGYRPFEGSRRIFIVDRAEDVTDNAQDALLKTLEEPPPSAILILVTAYPDSLLSTIRSRCRRLRFGALDDHDVRRVLLQADPRMSPDEAQRRASAAGGSVERALALDTDEFVDDRQAAFGLLRAVKRDAIAARLDASRVFAQVEKKRRARDAAYARLAILASLVRDLAALQARGADALANADLAGELEAIAPSFPGPRLVSAFGAIQQAETSIARNGNPKTVADWLAVTI
jgi:DNA polymerase-3 subunit delta'